MLTHALRHQTVAGSAATVLVKSGAGCLYSAYLHNANAAVRYLQFFDTVTLPTSTSTVPLISVAIPATAGVIVGVDLFTSFGWRFTTGLVWAYSTTRDVYTAATASEQQTLVFYI